MGGGDLNLKKSWHPQTIKNQEKVWKAEQADLKEKQRLDELRREIREEKNREDLKKIGQSSGVLTNNDNPKLEWMYKGPSDLLNREEYLLGRAIDKNFEQLDTTEKTEKEKEIVGVTVPKNHVEHECIPFSIRQYRSAQSTEQVDLQRKIIEDPLMLIKQKEMESRRKILENPVKLKELHRLLKIESVNKGNNKKNSKKEKKKTKKEHKKKSKYTTSDSSSDEEELDKLLAKKYMKVQSVFQKEENSVNLDFHKLMNLKYEKLSKELDKLLKAEQKRQKRARTTSTSSNSSEESRKHKYKKKDGSSSKTNPTKSQSKSRSKIHSEKKGRKSNSFDSSSTSSSDENLDNLLTQQYMKVRGEFQKDKNTANSSYDKPKRLDYDIISKELDRIVRSKEKQRQRSRNSSTSSNLSRRSPERNKRYSNSKNKRDRERSRSQNRLHPRSEENRKSRSKSRTRGRESRHYDKVDKRYNSAYSDRKRVENKSTHLETSSRHRQSSSNYHKLNSSTQISNKETKKLSEEEKEKRRREMMENALWRDEERTKTVKKYRDEYEKEKEIYESSEFDKTFINKELHKAMSNQKSVESRIKSNINNIQRSSRAMDTNFAKR